MVPLQRELFAAHAGIRHFKHMLEGRAFTLYTDHQSLIPSISKKTDAPTARQTNQLSEIAKYTTDIRFLEGKSNFVADALSRPNGEGVSEKVRKSPQVSNVSNNSKLGRHIFLQELDKIWVSQKDATEAAPAINNVQCQGCIRWSQSKIKTPNAAVINSIQKQEEDEWTEADNARMQKLLNYKEKTTSPSRSASAATARHRVSFVDEISPCKPNPIIAEFDNFFGKEMEKLGFGPPSSGSQPSRDALDDPL